MAETTSILMKAEGVTMRFGGLTALDNVDLQVNHDEVHGLIGPNGAGKTTIFNIITGIYSPTEGGVAYNGASIAGRTPQEIAQGGIIRTFQQLRLWQDLSILDNILLGMYMRPKPGIWQTVFNYRQVRQDFKTKTAEALEMAASFDPDLAERPLRQIRELSLVDRRRVEISRALVARPQLLLLDEPAAGMDPSETEQLMRDIDQMKAGRPGMGIIIIEHDMAVISTVAQKVTVLNFGKKIAEGDFDEVKRDTGVIEAYLGNEARDA
jgi:branched-chain amino acid transport system ATP-binding protein